jgi:hypothetical protein
MRKTPSTERRSTQAIVLEMAAGDQSRDHDAEIGG